MTDSSGEFGENSGIVPGAVRAFSSETGAAPLSSEATQGEIVTARGTADGLILRLDNGGVSNSEPNNSPSHERLKKGIWSFMDSRRHFVEGNEIILEWLAEKPNEEFILGLKQELSKEFGVTFKAATARNAPPTQPAKRNLVERTSIEREPAKSPSLFDGIEAIGLGNKDAKKKGDRAVPRSGSGSVWDDADSRLIYGTLRSGQKVETEHSVVIFGDVNSGAEVVAGGDVVVLGFLRGTAHAGAYDETGGGRAIFALNLQPTQLRIGSIISRGATVEGWSGPEIARVDGTLIVVEAYQAKGAPGPRK